MVAIAGLACDSKSQTPANRAGRADVVSTSRALSTGPAPLLLRGASWTYWDNPTNTNPAAATAPPDVGGLAWNQPDYTPSMRPADPNGWLTGAAPLGYGHSAVVTQVRCKAGPVPCTSGGTRFATTYFRASFNVDPAELPLIASGRLRVLVDDGAIAYLNGVEVGRPGTQPGALLPTDFTTLRTQGTNITALDQVDFPGTLLRAGQNVLAVEVHQASATSSDIVLDAEVLGFTLGIVRGPYLQNGTPHSAVVRWRTNKPTGSRVRWGSAPDALAHEVVDETPKTDHELTMTSLAASKTYYYAVGTESELLAGGDEDHRFTSLPLPGAAAPARIWVLGDAGTASTKQAAVRDAFKKVAGRADVLLFLGDNAYENGRDDEYQQKLFDIYPDILRNTFSWSAVGNHETAQAHDIASVLSSPYFNIFTLPVNGEAGGVPTGNPDDGERYFSHDFGDIHFIALDSMTWETVGGAPKPSFPPSMITWLESDLAANTRRWIVAYFHHPPYTKGTHDSDSTSADWESFLVRSQVLPVLESWGVDLVLSGHSHVYERSGLIAGHVGPDSTSDKFGPSNVVQSGFGQISFGGAYLKSETNPGAGAVYSVVGNSGGRGGGTKGLNHAAMLLGMPTEGSLVVDIDGSRLDGRYVGPTGGTADQFTIFKGAPANQPPVFTSLTASPATISTFPTSGFVTAAVTDADGTVTNVDFFLNGEKLPKVSALEASWTVSVPGTYQLLAQATDDQGATSLSSPVTLAFTPASPVLSATGGPDSVVLSWGGTSGTEQKLRIFRKDPGAASFTHVATVKAPAFGYLDGGLPPGSYQYKVEAWNSATSAAMSNTVTVTATAATAATAKDQLVSMGSRWKYLDNGTDQSATNWTKGFTGVPALTPLFDDTLWGSGVAQLGYGDTDEETVVSFGPSGSNKYITTYFRRAFWVSEPTAYSGVLKLGVKGLRDDGIVVYINGTMVFGPTSSTDSTATNMPRCFVDPTKASDNPAQCTSGGVMRPKHQIRAISAIEDETRIKTGIASNLVKGWNVVAVEIHQAAPDSSDISFDLEMRRVQASELACNGVDDNYDGLVDECTTGTGQCLVSGFTTCTNGVTGCTANGPPPGDVTAPVITGVTRSKEIIWPPTKKFVPITLTPTTTDNCGAAPTCYVFAVWNDDTVLCRDRGVGNLCPDYKVTAPLKVELRGEKNYDGADRTYTIKVVCRDGSGNASSTTTTVKVTDPDP